MSPRRWGWVLLAFFAAALVLPAVGGFWRADLPSLPLLWTAGLWFCALVSAPALRWHPAAGAWIAWILWRGVCVFHSSHPVDLAQEWMTESGAVLFFVLAHAWWGGAHRRLWVAFIWGLTPLAILLWPTALSSVLPCAAAAAAWAIWSGPAAYRPKWRTEIAVAGIAALAFVLLSAAWSALYAFFVSALLIFAIDRRSRGAAVVTFFAAAAGLVLSKFLPGASFLETLWRETGWIGLGLFLCAAVSSLPEGGEGLGWEGRAAAAVLYAMLAEACVDPASVALPVLAMFFSAAACVSPWARAREESGRVLTARLAEDGHEWNKPRWVPILGLSVCLLVMWARRMEHAALAASVSTSPAERLAGLRRLAAFEPGDAGARLDLARELMRDGPQRIGAPLAWLDEAIRLEPGNALFDGLKADLYFSVGDWRRGGYWAEKAVSLAPNFALARLMLAESLARGGDVARAKAQLLLARQLVDRGFAGPSRGGLADWDENEYRRVAEIMAHAR